MNEPVRTCVACARKAPQQALARFVAPTGTLVADPERRLPGRGVYTCRDAACFQKACKTGAFARRLRAPVRVPDELNRLFPEG